MTLKRSIERSGETMKEKTKQPKPKSDPKPGKPSNNPEPAKKPCKSKKK